MKDGDTTTDANEIQNITRAYHFCKYLISMSIKVLPAHM